METSPNTGCSKSSSSLSGGHRKEDKCRFMKKVGRQIRIENYQFKSCATSLLPDTPDGSGCKMVELELRVRTGENLQC